MATFDTFVVGVDGSTDASRSFRWAVAQAAVAGDGEVIAVHAFLPGAEPFAAAAEMNLAPARAERQRLLDADWTAAAAGRGLRVSTAVVDGEPAEVLVESAEHHGTAAIVIGRHGHGRWSEHHVGHVASQLLHRSPNPVILVGNTAKLEPLAGTIVVGLHGPTTVGHPAADWALQVAKRTGVSIEMVGVALPLAAGPGRGYSRDVYRADTAQIERLIQSQVEALVVEIRAQYPEVEVTGRAAVGHPTDVLVEAVGDLDATLMVVGSHHSTALTGFLADGVVRHLAPRLQCPLAAIPVP